MTRHTDAHSTDSDEPTTERSGYGRRPLLKALGIGTALSASGVVTAHDDGTDADIDPRYGDARPSADRIPADVPDHEVELGIADPIPDQHGPLFHFDPTGLAIEAGDVVQFTLRTPDHTITAYHPGHGFQQRVPDGVPPFSSPVVSAGGAWLYEFQQEGLYDLYCAPHHILGMTMRIVVGDLDDGDVPEYEDTFEGSEEPPLLPPFSKAMLEHELESFSEQGDNVRPEWVWLTPQEVLETEVLDPAHIQETGAVAFDAVLSEIDRMEDGHEHG
ncbi:Copper binding protein, plastocyanin/azurin family [Halobiforma haloterrestris]|uniref:Copper binding protein, plastocyanin/azurin family n=1 Tax=Natronobacterium haloterrestre TaxID=148448 RepID=A0A1I1LS41_NATHA|nr:plastocyanin/azurin family copper-binding protein [Halobiforma haloterrestris]SFC75805.1 Copper binding protein, plastocyanin/azurin family [Halobiforma haloterrestris]